MNDMSCKSVRRAIVLAGLLSQARLSAGRLPTTRPPQPIGHDLDLIDDLTLEELLAEPFDPRVRAWNGDERRLWCRAHLPSALYERLYPTPPFIAKRQFRR